MELKEIAFKITQTIGKTPLQVSGNRTLSEIDARHIAMKVIRTLLSETKTRMDIVNVLEYLADTQLESLKKH